MKTPSLWQVIIPLRKGQEEAVQDLLEDFFQTPACAYTAADSDAASVSVYLSEKPAPSSLADLRERLRHLPALGRHARQGGGDVVVKRLTARDWVKAWQRNIRPIRIGKALLIRPTWDTTPPRPGQQLIVLDPGLSFGTGHHPTTHYCLQELVRLSRRGTATFLDLGTGSGLLAIAAARLGYRHITALDNDPEAVRTARANARANGVGRRIRFFQADVASYTPPRHQAFDVVAANLTDELLVQHAARIAGCAASRGHLVLAGILTERFPAVQKTYAGLGLQLLRRHDRGEWTGATFVVP
jgi:ribosomal protein L11 methyltransferase